MLPEDARLDGCIGLQRRDSSVALQDPGHHTERGNFEIIGSIAPEHACPVDQRQVGTCVEVDQYIASIHIAMAEPVRRRNERDWGQALQPGFEVIDRSRFDHAGRGYFLYPWAWVKIVGLRSDLRHRPISENAAVQTREILTEATPYIRCAAWLTTDLLKRNTMNPFINCVRNGQQIERLINSNEFWGMHTGSTRRRNGDRLNSDRGNTSRVVTWDA